MTLRNFSSTAAQTTLSAGVTAASTTLTVAGTTGFPPAPFVLAVNAGASAQELVLVTAVAGNNLTVTRGYDSTVASAHDAGAAIQHSHAALDFREANTHVNATSGVHGLAGGLVGTSDAQTLTGKTLALGSNTVTGTKAQFNSALTDADFKTSTDAEFLAWTAYTPTVSGFSVGGGSTSGRYVQIGKTVHFRARAVLGAGFSISGGLGLSLPVAASSSVAAHGALTGYFTDTGTSQYITAPLMTTTHAFSYYLGASGVAATPNATTPFTWASGDEVVIAGTYEAA